MMVECLKHKDTSHSSKDLLKVCVKVGASCWAQTLRQVGDTVWSRGLPYLLSLKEPLHLLFTDHQSRGGDCWGSQGSLLSVS